MNAVGLVFGLLLIFTCTFSLSLRKAVLSEPVEKTFRAHNIASQKILNNYESARYKRIKKKNTPEPKKNSHGNKTNDSTPKEIDLSENRDCARLNLWPLIEEDKNSHQTLYQVAAQIIRNLYAQKLSLEPKFEYELLDALIAAAKSGLKKNLETTGIALEKLSLPERKKSSLQMTYYTMLKGTKLASSEKSYPSLMDTFILEKEASRLCLTHAPAPLLEALFGSRAAKKILLEAGNKEARFNKEKLRELCMREENIHLNDEFLNLFSFQSNHSAKNQKIFVEDEKGIRLKKKVFFAS